MNCSICPYPPKHMDSFSSSTQLSLISHFRLEMMFGPTFGIPTSLPQAKHILIGTRQVHSAFKWLWKSSCQPKRKFFFWLLLQDRLSTREILKRRNMELQCYDCVLCHLDTEESLMHLFFSCPFSMSCWNTLGLAPMILDDLFQTLSAFRMHLR